MCTSCGHAGDEDIGRFLFGGAVLRGSFEQVGYVPELLCAAAGPMSNVLLAFLFRQFPIVVGANTVLAVYNLLPLRGNDGAVMLRCIGMHRGADVRIFRVFRIAQEILYAACVMIGAWVFWFGALADTGGTSVGYGVLYFCLLARLFEKTT